MDNEDGERGGRVLGYWEKPGEYRSNWASMTIMCFRPQVLYQALAANQASESFEFGRDIIPMLMARGARIYGYKHRGYWGYTRTVDEYWQANMDLLGDAPAIDMEQWGLRTNLEHRAIRDSQPTLIREQGAVRNSLLYNGCVIEGEVSNSILFPGVHVGAGALVENSVLFFNNVVEPGCLLNKVVGDVNTRYGAGSLVGAAPGETAAPVTVVGWNNQVPPGSRIGAGATIFPRIGAEFWPQVVEAGRTLS